MREWRSRARARPYCEQTVWMTDVVPISPWAVKRDDEMKRRFVDVVLNATIAQTFIFPQFLFRCFLCCPVVEFISENPLRIVFFYRYFRADECSPCRMARNKPCMNGIKIHYFRKKFLSAEISIPNHFPTFLLNQWSRRKLIFIKVVIWW